MPTTDAAHAQTVHIETNLGIEIRGIGIPPRPSILDKIDQEMRREEPNFRALGELISADVGLSASLLKIVNSPFYGFNRQVRSIHEALMVLGIKAVANTVAGLSLKKSFAHLPQMERFWDASACTARVSGWIAQTLGQRMCGVRSEEAYTFGLFRDCGVPVLMTPFPDYPEVLKKANEETDRLFTDVEDELIGMNHASVGAAMAKEWLFPEELIQAIRFHHDMYEMKRGEASQVREISRRFIAVSQVAEYLIQVRTGKNTTHEWNKLGPASLELLDIGESELRELHELSEPAVLADG